MFSVPCSGSVSMGSQMSTLLQRLAGVTDMIAHLNAQIRELEQARDLVRKARLSARRARRSPVERGAGFRMTYASVVGLFHYEKNPPA
jgi:hypothetical protein